MIEINKKKNSNLDKKKISTIIGIVVAVIFAIVVIIFSFSTNSSNDETTPPSPNITNVKIGETFELEDIKITILDYYFSYYAFDTTTSFAAGKDKVFLMVHAKLENPNTSRTMYDTITNSLYYITDNGEARYNNKYFNYSDWLLASNYLDPLEVATGYYMFQLPENIVPPYPGNPSYMTPQSDWYEGVSKLTSTQGKNFEIRFQQNKTKPDDIIKIKL